jgi:acyl carrier protein
MDEPAILAQLAQICRTIFDDQSIVLTHDMTAEDVPGWDSMNHIFLVVEIERQFGVKFQTAEMEELRNVGELVTLIGAKLASRAA